MSAADGVSGRLSSLYRASWKRWRESRRAGQIARSGKGYEPFHGDSVLQTIVDEIIERCGISTFVETGTFVGDTTKYVASRHPDLRVYTCEINPRWYELARRLCQGLDNIEFFQGESPLFLKRLRNTLLSKKTLFWLDAHWGDFWPLFDETEVISTLPAYVVFVDDFEVPDRPVFQYDTYHGTKNCLAVHRWLLGDRCFVPDYDPDAQCKNPVGYGVFFKNIEHPGVKSMGNLKVLGA